jgi:hypothetical protein
MKCENLEEYVPFIFDFENLTYLETFQEYSDKLKYPQKIAKLTKLRNLECNQESLLFPDCDKNVSNYKFENMMLVFEDNEKLIIDNISVDYLNNLQKKFIINLNKLFLLNDFTWNNFVEIYNSL